MKSFRWSSLVVYLMVLLSIVFGGLLSTLIFGWVNGEEFSPQTFQVRGFEYLQVPLLRVQVLGVERTAPRAANANLGQWIPADAAPPRWDLVRGVSGHQPGPAGDAAILLAYIDSSQGGSAPWDAWNRAHPKLAAEFWPLVAQVARENAYAGDRPGHHPPPRIGAGVGVPLDPGAAREAVPSAVLRADRLGVARDIALKPPGAGVRRGFVPRRTSVSLDHVRPQLPIGGAHRDVRVHRDDRAVPQGDRSASDLDARLCGPRVVEFKD